MTCSMVYNHHFASWSLFQVCYVYSQCCCLWLFMWDTQYGCSPDFEKLFCALLYTICSSLVFWEPLQEELWTFFLGRRYSYFCILYLNVCSIEIKHNKKKPWLELFFMFLHLHLQEIMAWIVPKLFKMHWEQDRNSIHIVFLSDK